MSINSLTLTRIIKKIIYLTERKTNFDSYKHTYEH